jgi:hypothetical protein
MRFPLLSLIAFLSVSRLSAQQLGHFDVLLFASSRTADSTWHLSAPRFLTAFNPKGYNNQPAFFPGNELYLTVQMPDDTTQTDLYALDPGAHTRTRVTATPATSEYSPTPMPGGRRFSAIRVETGGVQRLWSFPLDRSDNGRPEFPAIKGVGYHSWLNDTLVALFIVGDQGQPHILYTCGLKGQKLQRIASDVGRGFYPLPGNKLVFVQKATEQTWFLKTWDLKKQTGAIVIKMPAGTEDFAVTPDGTYLAGNGPKLFQFKPGLNADWKEIADLSRYGVHKISRLAVGRDGKVAVVVQ